MVQAKTEDGNWRTVPLYKAGMDVCYRNDNDVQECKILTVHHDDLLEPYYTVRLLDGKEKQTDNTHIMLRLQDGKKCDEEGMTHQDIARERHAQRAFILQKQRMKRGKWTIKNYWESLLPEKKAHIFVDDAVAHQKYRKSLPPKKKAHILVNDAMAHQRYQKLLPPKKKAHILVDNAVAHQKHRESLLPKKKAQILEDNAAAHKKYQESLPPKKKAKILEDNVEGKKTPGVSPPQEESPNFGEWCCGTPKIPRVPPSQEESPNFGG